MLQTVVAGSGAIHNTVWIPDVGVAICSNRSMVRESSTFPVKNIFIDFNNDCEDYNWPNSPKIFSSFSKPNFFVPYTSCFNRA